MGKMKRRDNHSTVRHQNTPCVKVVLNCCLVAFYVLFVLCENGGGLRNIPLGNIGQSFHYFHASFISADHHSSQRPLRTKVAAVVSEVKDSSESENDYHHEIGKLSHRLPLEIAFTHSGKSLFLQLRLANESLARISLVVLHHCWKSYLS